MGAQSMDFFTHYNIAINAVGITDKAARKRYFDQVHEHLMWIYRTKMGKILLAAIKYHGLPVEIQPYTGTGCNASGGGRIVDGALEGFVAYSPNTFALHGPCSATKLKATKKNRGLLGDEILFHELVHVFRNVSRKWSQRALTGALFQYTDTEEFIAVMVTNIYISDRTNRIKTGLRGSHKGYGPLGAKFSKGVGFFARGSRIFELVKKFCEDNPGFTTRVATEVGDAEFNPLADYYLTPDQAEEASKSAATFHGLADIMAEMMEN